MYLGILRSFAANTMQLLYQVKEVTRDNLDDYAITVHGLKGSCRAIFAEDIGNMAEALERASKAGDFDFVSENNQYLMGAVEELVSELKLTLDSIDLENTKPLRDKPNRDDLKRLTAACRKYDMDGAEAVLSELETYRYEHGADLIDRLRLCLDEADFSGIAKEISRTML